MTSELAEGYASRPKRVNLDFPFAGCLRMEEWSAEEARLVEIE